MPLILMSCVILTCFCVFGMRGISVYIFDENTYGDLNLQMAEAQV
jgi:hypothetical protein